MKVVQLTIDEVKNNMNDSDIYRITVCDDTHGNSGKRHFSARLKPLKNMSIEEFNESLENEDDFAFIKIYCDKVMENA